MKRALLLFVLVACERDRGVQLHLPPQTVGARSTYHMRLDGSIKAHDGTELGMHHEQTLIFVVEAVGPNDRAERIRVTVDRDDNVFAGTPKSTLSGTYEANSDGTATRADGKPLTAEEVAFFHDLKDPGSDPVAMKHEFRAGDTFRPTAAEMTTFGLADSTTPVAYTVRRAVDGEIVLAGDFTPPGAIAGDEAHGHVVITMTPWSHTSVADVSITRNGSDAGAMHVTTELHRQR